MSVNGAWTTTSACSVGVLVILWTAVQRRPKRPSVTSMPTLTHLLFAPTSLLPTLTYLLLAPMYLLPTPTYLLRTPTLFLWSIQPTSVIPSGTYPVSFLSLTCHPVATYSFHVCTLFMCFFLSCVSPTPPFTCLVFITRILSSPGLLW